MRFKNWRLKSGNSITGSIILGSCEAPFFVNMENDVHSNKTFMLIRTNHLYTVLFKCTMSIII